MSLWSRPSPATRSRLAVTLFVIFGIASLLLLALSALGAPEWLFYLVIWGFPVIWVLAGVIIACRASD
jgi:hypothetical protein